MAIIGSESRKVAVVAFLAALVHLKSCLQLKKAVLFTEEWLETFRNGCASIRLINSFTSHWVYLSVFADWCNIQLTSSHFFFFFFFVHTHKSYQHTHFLSFPLSLAFSMTHIHTPHTCLPLLLRAVPASGASITQVFDIHGLSAWSYSETHQKEWEKREKVRGRGDK